VDHSIEIFAGTIGLRRATLADVEAVLRVMDDANERPRAMGIDMWAWVRTPAAERIVARHIDESAFYVGESNGEIVATVRIGYDDVEIWGDAGADGAAGYVHSLSVVRKLSGQRVGKELLMFSERLIADGGRPLLRLDCMAENPKICAYYRNLGFADRGVGSDERFSWQRWERKIGEPWL
jgi:ribosomal protein S18 acetylase RimI-like enzyme